MKNLIKDEGAILTPSLTAMMELALIVILYFMLMPLLTFITNVLINMGAPADVTLFYLKMAQWGFLLFALGVIIVLLANVWKKTHDTGTKNQFNGYR